MTDNAKNMVAAFQDVPSAGCLSHSLQLVIDGEILKQASVKTLIEKVRKLVGHANHSNIFYTELNLQQRLQMNASKELVLIQDVATRWNSTFYMLERCFRLKAAIIPTIAKLVDVKVEFTNQDWIIMEKIVKVLKCFEEATQMLSKSDASMAQAIPIVTTIIKQLETDDADYGVKTSKRNLKGAVVDRFRFLETKKENTKAMFLDSRYKAHFYLDPNTIEEVKKSLIAELVAILSDCPEAESEVSKPSKEEFGFEKAMSKIIQRSVSQQDSPSFEATQFIDSYANSPPEKDVLGFWKRKAQSSKPVERAAAKLAEKYLTPPATSVDVERLFSTAGDILTKERNRLKPENVSKVLFLRENLPLVNFQY